MVCGCGVVLWGFGVGIGFGIGMCICMDTAERDERAGGEKACEPEWSLWCDMGLLFVCLE